MEVMRKELTEVRKMMFDKRVNTRNTEKCKGTRHKFWLTYTILEIKQNSLEELNKI